MTHSLEWRRVTITHTYHTSSSRQPVQKITLFINHPAGDMDLLTISFENRAAWALDAIYM